ncbi:DUF3772 domain-containing protein [Amorphus orientalis]|uniref:Small-conductance mechanosensitive channel n=1 Tax=Amorphus orientalis TaxID=649198 RepID=A0AAE4ARN7_9HYPH|nr:DUF3772 domain-containing protein [Amorphus orientalis]MDQ0314055.1 small-conductance mechanosensitive channel [Amorphus orientalis]
MRSSLRSLSGLFLVCAVLGSWSVAALAQGSSPVTQAPDQVPQVLSPLNQSEPSGQADQAAETGDAGNGTTTPATPHPGTQGGEPVAPANVDPADQALVDSWRTQLDQIGSSLNNSNLSDEALVDLRRTAATLRDQITPLIDRLQPRANALQARLDELNLPAEQSALEPETLRNEREAQTRLLVALEAILKQAYATRLRADELIATIEDRRRQQFAERIGERRRSMLDLTLWQDIIVETPRALTSLRYLFEDWKGLVQARSGWQLALASTGLLIFAIVLAWPVRRYLYRITNRDPTLTSVSKLSMATHAAAIASVNFGVVVAVMLALFAMLEGFQMSAQRIDQMLLAALQSLALFAAIRGLAVAIVAPNRPAWRFLPVADSFAEKIMHWVILYGSVFTLGHFMVAMSNVLALPLPVVQGVQGLFAVLTAAASMGTLHAIARGLNHDSESPDGGSIAVWRWLLPPAWLTAIVALLAPFGGYLTLGWFLVGQVVWIALVLSILYLALVLVDEFLTAAFRPGTAIGGVLLRNLRLRPATIEQIGAILSGIGRLLMIATAGALLLTPFGVTGADLIGTFRRSVTGLSIGSVTISPAAIVTALLVFAIGMVATRALQRWLDTRFLPHTRMDVGLKTSVRTGLGYLGVIMAGVIAFSVAGFNLQNVAIIAGALSVGVGFGLQSIVNNFVSGLILLAERPIKAGDWIVVGAEQGYVKRINVRSTEIETFDRSTVIVPNSDLISGVVKNWMHTDTSGRVIIDVRVPFDSDPDKVHDLLLEVAETHPNVLAYPEAKVYLSNFGESALEFQIFCYLGNVDYMLSAKSELRMAAFRTLRENGIEIPYTRRDLHILDLETLKHLMKPEDADAEEDEPPRQSRPRKRRRKPRQTPPDSSQPAEPLDLPDGDGDGGGDAV